MDERGRRARSTRREDRGSRTKSALLSVFGNSPTPLCDPPCQPAQQLQNARRVLDLLWTIKLAPLKHDIKIQTPIQRRQAEIHILKIQIRRLILDEPLPQIPIEDMHQDILWEPGRATGDGDVPFDVDGEAAEDLAVAGVLVRGFRVDGGDGAALGDLAGVRDGGDGVVAREVGDEHLAAALGEDGGGERRESEDEGLLVHFLGLGLGVFKDDMGKT